MATVLVIDDEPAQRELMRLLLEEAGHTVIDVADGEAGLEKLRESVPDVVVLDIFMPERDGLSLLRLMRKEFAGLPAVVISGYKPGPGQPDYLSIARSLGAVASIERPQLVPELLEAVNRALRDA